jgi:hypothetical protein
MRNLHQKINDKQLAVILYEIIPPPSKAQLLNVEAYAKCAVELLNSTSVNIDGINIPDIRDEQREGERGTKYVSKCDAREFGKRLQESSQKYLDIVINRVTVHEDITVQKAWLKETMEVFGIHDVILVGGESSKIQYPGPSVKELTQIVNAEFKELYAGAIVIPTRANEEARLIEKTQYGTNFFTSQVIYEPFHIKKILKDYHTACLKKNLTPKRIFLSFAPISTKKDMEFLKWLGVVLPESVEKILFESDIGVGWRSVKVAKAILNSILAFLYEEGINVPIGLNIEHISRHNFELSKEFIEGLGQVYCSSYETKYKIF